MEYLELLFGSGENLNALQMSMRAFVLFIYLLFLIRISGRRSFGLNAPFDIIIMVLLGAILSRAIVGASSLLPTAAACLIITILHRIVGILAVSHSSLEDIVKGQKILLFQDGKFINEGLHRGLVSKEDLYEAVRLSLNQDNFNNIDKIFIESNGKISIVKK